MPAPALSYGLNVPKKAGLNPRTAPKRKTIFDDDSGSEDGTANGNAAEEIETFDDSAPIISTPKSGKDNTSASKKPSIGTHSDLSASHDARKQALEAQALDPSVYNYDEVYDSLHAKSSKFKESTGPKYMASLLAAAEVRKRDQLRAKDVMLAKEREAEGDEFADKEKFVTAAYKAQQEEVRRLEEEEREKERREAERRRKMGGGMTGLYKGLLEREEARHDAAIKAVEEGKGEEDVAEESNEKTEAELARERGAVLNDEGQVVDKRELLQAGLNVKAKPKPPVPDSSEASRIKPSESMSILQGRGNSKAAMRARQTKMLEEQLAEATKRAADDADAERAALERSAKSRKTEGEISSAKERYLQRKREAEAAKAAEKDP